MGRDACRLLVCFASLPTAFGCGRSDLTQFDSIGFDSGDAVDDALPDDCDLSSHESDCDGDTIPDADDPSPADRDEPGTVRRDVIYANTSDALLVFDPATLAVEQIGLFGGTVAEAVTDLAIDRFGVLYAVSFSAVYVCNPESVRCDALTETSANAAAFVPVGVVDNADDGLIIMGVASTWTHVKLRGAEATLVSLGNVGPTYSSSGDIVAVHTGATLFTSPSSTGFDIVVAVDAPTAAIVSEVASTPSVYGTFGLAAFDGGIWLFDAAGGIARMDAESYAIDLVTTAPFGWWGAAAHPSAR